MNSTSYVSGSANSGPARSAAALRPDLAALKAKIFPASAASQAAPEEMPVGSAPSAEPDSEGILKSNKTQDVSLESGAMPAMVSQPTSINEAQAANSAELRESHIKQFPRPALAQAAPPKDEEKLPYQDQGLPEHFPHNVFPAFIRKVAGQLASVYQAPMCVTVMCLLAALSAAVGKSVVVKRAVRDLLTTLNLYVMIVAERGTCKSVIGQKATAPLQQFSDKLLEDHRQKVANQKCELAVLKKEVARLDFEVAKADGAGRPELLDRLSDKHRKIGELERGASQNVTAVVSDITGEALARALEDNGETLFSYSPEAGSVVSVTAGKYRDGKADLDPYLSGYSGDPMRTNRVDRSQILVKQPCMTLLWLMQSIVAMDLVGNRDTIPRGFTARTLLFDSGARREYDNRENESFTLVEEWSECINKLLLRRKLATQPKEITCTAEAREVFAKFHDEGVDLERKWCPDLEGEFSRQRENAVKIAGLFALLEESEEISAEIAARATEVVRWVGYNYLSLIHSERKKRSEKDMEKLWEILTESGGRINLGVLNQRHGITRKKVNALIALNPNLIALEKISQPAGKAGRHGEVVRFANKIEIIEKLNGEGAAA